MSRVVRRMSCSLPQNMSWTILTETKTIKHPQSKQRKEKLFLSIKLVRKLKSLHVFNFAQVKVIKNHNFTWNFYNCVMAMEKVKFAKKLSIEIQATEIPTRIQNLCTHQKVCHNLSLSFFVPKARFRFRASSHKLLKRKNLIFLFIIKI